MKILQIVSYVSVDGSFGGPVAVAVAQAEEFARQGHDVELWAGHDGHAQLAIEGVRVRLFRSRQIIPIGFSGMIAPGLTAAFRKDAAKFDVVHIHLARDLMTTRIATLSRRQRKFYVCQTHGMVMPDERIRAQVWDRLWIRSALRDAAAVFVLSEKESNGIRIVSRYRANIVRVLNGIRAATAPLKASDEYNRVVFLARLHRRKRVEAFAEAAELMASEHQDLVFEVHGPDEGDLPLLLEHIQRNGEVRLTYKGAVEQGKARETLSGALAYVLPSFGEVVPMTVLEALDVGVPVVMTDDCAIAELLRVERAAIVTDGTPAQLALAVAELKNPATRAELVAGGQRALRSHFEITTVCRQVEQIYLTAPSLKSGG